MTSHNAPKIEGSLKDTINSIAFGLVGAVLIVNFGIAWIPNFFPWVMGILVVVQLILFLPQRAKPDYEKYVQPKGRKGRHIIYSQTGQMVLEVSLESQESTPKGRSSRIRDRFRKKGQKGGTGEAFLEVPKDGRVRRSSGSSDREQDVPSSKEERPVEIPTLTNEDKDENQEKEREINNEKEKETVIETKPEEHSDKGEKEDEDEKEKIGYWKKRFHLGMSRN